MIVNLIVNNLILERKMDEMLYVRKERMAKIDASIAAVKRVFTHPVLLMFVVMFGFGALAAMAQNSAGDYSAGTDALETVTSEIVKYVPIVVKLCYAIAGVVAVVGAISVYIAMNNEEQDVKKKIMMIVGACIFLIAAAQALPLFFGIE